MSFSVCSLLLVVPFLFFFVVLCFRVFLRWFFILLRRPFLWCSHVSCSLASRFLCFGFIRILLRWNRFLCVFVVSLGWPFVSRVVFLPGDRFSYVFGFPPQSQDGSVIVFPEGAQGTENNCNKNDFSVLGSLVLRFDCLWEAELAIPKGRQQSWFTKHRGRLMGVRACWLWTNVGGCCHLVDRSDLYMAREISENSMTSNIKGQPGVDRTWDLFAGGIGLAGAARKQTYIHR